MMKALSISILLAFTMAHLSMAIANDDCKNAILLPPVGNKCQSEQYSNIGASAEEVSIAANPSCGSYVGADVWFKLVLPTSGALRIEVSNLSGSVTPSYTLYSGRCGTFTELVCVRNDNGKTVYYPEHANDTVYIRVYSFFSMNGINFTLCAYEPEMPINNLCDNATLLEVGSECKPGNFTNVFATSSPTDIVPNPSCGSYSGGDVWFKVVMPPSGMLRINKNRITGTTHPSMTIYSGTCGNFTEILCSLNDRNESLYAPELVGELIYLRFYGYYNEEGGAFSLCLYEDDAPLNDSCVDAMKIIVGSDCQMVNYTNKHATEEPASIAPYPSCGQYAGADVWFKAVLPASGAIRVETGILTGAAPPSITFYSGTCGNFTEINCMSLDNGKTIIEPSLAGKTIYFRVFRYNSNDGVPFPLCIYEPKTAPNYLCDEAIVLPVGETCVLETFSNAFIAKNPGTESVPSCGHYRGGDVWFKFLVPPSGRMLLTITNLQTSVSKSAVFYSGNCGKLEEIMCSELSTNIHFHQPQHADQEVFLRIFSYNSEEGGPFTLCAYDPGCDPETVELGEVVVCKGESFRLGDKIISKAGTYNESLKNQKGCDSLVSVTVSVNEVNTRVDQEEQNLTAQAVEANYQWIDCHLNEALSQATERTFIPVRSGDYAVIVTKNSCSDTSSCYRVDTEITVSVADMDDDRFLFYPNPVIDMLSIELPQMNHDMIWIEVMDTMGRRINSGKYHYSKKLEIDMHAIPSGIYMMRLITDDKILVRKIVRQ